MWQQRLRKQRCCAPAMHGASCKMPSRHTSLHGCLSPALWHPMSPPACSRAPASIRHSCASTTMPGEVERRKEASKATFDAKAQVSSDLGWLRVDRFTWCGSGGGSGGCLDHRHAADVIPLSAGVRHQPCAAGVCGGRRQGMQAWTRCRVATRLSRRQSEVPACLLTNSSLPSTVQALKEGGLLQPGAVVLDFGCGTGLLAMAIADGVGSVLGVDSSQGMVQVSAARCCWTEAHGADCMAAGGAGALRRFHAAERMRQAVGSWGQTAARRHAESKLLLWPLAHPFKTSTVPTTKGRGARPQLQRAGGVLRGDQPVLAA